MSNVFKPAHAALLAAGTALALLGAAGCSNNQPQTPPTVVSTPPPATTTVTTPPATAPSTPGGAPATKINVNAGPGGSMGTNSGVADAVNKAIVTNKEMTGSRVEVVVDASGVATLTGTVQDQQQKALAARTATNTPGVSSVKNKIEIVPTGGAKSASKPPVTKVIVVHEQASAPKSSSAAPPSPQSSPAPPASPDSSDNSNGASGNGSNGAGGTDSTSTPPSPPSSGSGQ